MTHISPRRDIEGALPTVAELLRHRNQGDALRVLTQAEIELDQTGYDNWDGGTEIWTVCLRLPIHVFVSIEENRSALVETIEKDLTTVLGTDTGFWVNIEISPRKTIPPGARVPDGILSDQTRRAILDEMRARGTVWYGAMDEIDFLDLRPVIHGFLRLEIR